MWGTGIGVEIGEARGRRTPWVTILLALLMTVLAVGAAAQYEGNDPRQTLSFTELETLALPGPGRVTGLTWMGPDTLAVLLDIPDTVSASGQPEIRLIFRNTAGTVLLDEEFSGVLARGLAWDGKSLWSCGDADDGSSIIYEVGADTLGVWQVLEAYDAPGHRPTGMCFDGRFVWISDRDSGRIDRWDPEVAEITRSTVAPGFSPVGLAWDGRSMWVTDAGTGLMCRLTGSRRTWSATIDPEVFMRRGRDVLLLAEGDRFWIVPEGANMAVRIRFQ